MCRFHGSSNHLKIWIFNFFIEIFLKFWCFSILINCSRDSFEILQGHATYRCLLCFFISFENINFSNSYGIFKFNLKKFNLSIQWSLQWQTPAVRDHLQLQSTILMAQVLSNQCICPCSERPPAIATTFSWH